VVQPGSNIHPTSGSPVPNVVAKPILAHVAEGSVLDEAEARGLVPFVIGGRRRFATCGGVAWFNGHHLAVVNLYGGHLRVYRFHDNDGRPRLELMHEMRDGLSFPEDVAAAPNGSLLAIAHSMSDAHGISLHRIEAGSLRPEPAIAMVRLGPAFHGMGFTPDSRHLAFTELSGAGHIEVIQVETGECACRLDNDQALLKPKGVSFSRDGCFAAIAFAPPAVPFAEDTPCEEVMGGLMTVHRFDAQRGSLEREPVATWRSTGGLLGAVESCTVLSAPSGHPFRILTVDQAGDAVLAFDFDPRRSVLSYAGVFAPGMSFPHGIDASADGRFVAVANYGDDTLRILSLGQGGGLDAPALPRGLPSAVENALIDRVEA